MQQTTKKIKDIDVVITYLKTTDYYSNKTEENVKRLLKQNIEKFKDDKISISFLAAFCSELLYFNNSIGKFKDLQLRDALMAGDELSYLLTFSVEDISKRKALMDRIVDFMQL